MKMNKHTARIVIASLGLAALLAYADAGQSLKIDFSDETQRPIILHPYARARAREWLGTSASRRSRPLLRRR